MTAKIIGVLGRIWLGVATAIIMLGYIWIALTDGVGRLLEILNPWNFLNIIAVMITLAPGFGLLWLSDRLRQRPATSEKTPKP